MRLFIFGMDGATFDLIQPWIEQGRLPNFKRLLEQSAWTPLESVPSMRSPAAWTTFMTGCNPGKHGLYEFYEQEPGTYGVRFVNGGSRKVESLWSLMTRLGKRVIAVNVPMTWPAEKVDGVMLAGLDAPGPSSPGFCHPPEVLKEIERECGRYILEPGITGCIVSGRPDLAVERLHEELEQKERVTRFLMNKPWDVFCVVFRSLDAVQHAFWKYMDESHPLHDPAEAEKYGNVIRETYEQLDASLGRIWDSLDDDTHLMVMSDHGFGRKHPCNSQLPRWLESHGWLTRHEAAATGSNRGLLTQIAATAYRSVIGRLPRTVKERLAQQFPALRNRVQSRLMYEGIDWSSTVAYADSLFATVTLNVQGREPLGIVEPGEAYDRLVDTIRAAILELRDVKTGEKIVAAVHHRDEIYTGEYVKAAPDLLIQWREDIVIHGIDLPEGFETAADESGPMIPGEDPRIISGDHHRFGVFALVGPGIRPGRIDHATLADLTPTALQVLGLPTADYMDGRVLAEAFASPLEAPHAPVETDRHVPTAAPPQPEAYSTEDEAAIRQRLRDLGYVE